MLKKLANSFHNYEKWSTSIPPNMQFPAFELESGSSA
jgi:hypothetical protein